jgi:hypothetical protein
MTKCGHSEYEKYKHTNHYLGTVNKNALNVREISAYTIDNVQEHILYTSYLGKVKIHVKTGNNGDVVLEKIHKVNGKDILIKVIDYQVAQPVFNKFENNKPQPDMPGLSDLYQLPSKTINLIDNKLYYILTLCVLEIIAKLENNNIKLVKIQELLNKFNIEDKQLALMKYPQLSITPQNNINYYKKIYQDVLTYNSAVDIIFNTQHYLDFLFEKTGLHTVNNLQLLLSVNGVPNLDNAFFTGEFMVYGEGKDSFYPLVAMDVVAHELSHGLVSGTADLEYTGHSGALNESFSDVMGTMFEWYMYDKYNNDSNKDNDISGTSDWDIGEELDIKGKYLRSMSNPTSAQQPSKYQGTYYLNPNRLETDGGGVHINSGIPNHCFYLLAEKLNNKNQALKIFIDCLYSLNSHSNFMDFRDTLKRVSNNDKNVCECLIKVGLLDGLKCDDNTKYNCREHPQQLPPPPPQLPPQLPPQQLPPQQLPPQLPQQLPPPQMMCNYCPHKPQCGKRVSFQRFNFHPQFEYPSQSNFYQQFEYPSQSNFHPSQSNFYQQFEYPSQSNFYPQFEYPSQSNFYPQFKYPSQSNFYQ